MIKNYYSANYLQNELKNEILKDNPVMMGSFVQPTSGFFKFQDEISLYFDAFNVLKNLELVVLNDIKNYPKTAKTFINFIKELKLYNISIDALPQTSLIQKDIFKVCKQLWPLVVSPINLSVNDFVLKTGITHAEHLFAKNNLIDYQKQNKLEQIRYFYAQNKRQEVESIFQDIANKELTQVSLVVPNYNDYLPIIESVIKRFGLDISLQTRSLYLIKNQYLNTLNFLVEQTIQTFISMVQSNLLNLKYPNLYIQYLKHFNLTLDDLKRPLDLATDQQHPIYRIQYQIQDDHQIVAHFLDHDYNNSYLQKHITIYNMLAKTHGIKVGQFKNLLENYDTYFTQENHDLIVTLIDGFRPKHLKQDKLNIYDYNSLPLSIPGHVYYLGLTAQNFPGISEKTGIIDEGLYKEIEGFPLQQDRVEFELAQKRRVYQLGNYRTYSYHIANYEGKSLEPSYEIQEFCEQNGVKATLWPMISVRNTEATENKLHEELAKKLFLTDNQLYASVSSLQKYVSYPDDYFFEYGLKVREPQTTEFNALVLGNLNHRIVEKQTIDSVWEHIYQSYPIDDLQLKVIKDKNDNLMQKNLSYLKLAQKESSFMPTKFEEVVSGNQIIPQVYLKGFIDRIDYSDQFFTIVDYKSSPTNLSLNHLIDGTQLQLLTYAYLISQIEHKQAMAVMYYSFASPNTINARIHQYSVSKGVVKESQEFVEDYIKEKRYSAWFFNDISSFFDTDLYWKGLSNTKNGMKVSYFGRHNFDVLIEILKNRYEIIYDLITNGIFEKDLIEKALDVSQEVKDEWKERVKS